MEYEKEYCLKCGKENIKNKDVCECGSKDFVYGNNFTYTVKDGVVCNCGNKMFEKISHINANPHYITTYACTECNNTVVTETYYESPYL
jgi:hypothetical protein